MNKPKGYIKKQLSPRSICKFRAIYFSMPEGKRNRDGVIDWVIDSMRKPRDKREHNLLYYKKIGDFFSKASDKTIEFIISDKHRYLYMDAFRPALISTADGEGYERKALQRFLKSIHLDKEFSDWFNGQTGGITEDGKFFVYKWDVDRFLEQHKK